MPAEQALTRARGLSGPSHGSADGGARSSGARLEQTAALFAPVALIVGLALSGGGFDVVDRHIAGLLAWLVVVGLLVLGPGSRARLGWPLYSAAGLFVCLALLSAMSSLWSGSVELSVIEADRVLVYLSFFVAAFLISQTSQARQRFGEGIALALIGVAALALASRLLPDLLSVAEGPGTGPRLSYPLGYWNADGVLFGIAAGMTLWMTRRSLNAAVRWLAVVSLPVALLALYFTYSRGGLVALALSCGCLIALSQDRLWLLPSLAIGVVGALPAVLAVQARHSLAQNVNDAQITDQGLAVLAFLAAG